jgi:hypothetical protein
MPFSYDGATPTARLNGPNRWPSAPITKQTFILQD